MTLRECPERYMTSGCLGLICREERGGLIVEKEFGDFITRIVFIDKCPF
jgi:hypothetical protein